MKVGSWPAFPTLPANSINRLCCAYPLGDFYAESQVFFEIVSLVPLNGALKKSNFPYSTVYFFK